MMNQDAQCSVFFNEGILNTIDSYLTGADSSSRVVSVMLYENQFPNEFDFEDDQYQLQLAWDDLNHPNLNEEENEDVEEEEEMGRNDLENLAQECDHYEKQGFELGYSDYFNYDLNWKK
jgi:hypothetical protein